MDDLRPLISPIGLGAFKIGRNQGTKYEQAYELPDDPSVERLLNGALGLGVTFIDTAPAYGVSEERIGRFLSHRRAEFVLSTKVGERYENGQSTYDFSRDTIRQSIEHSLRQLRTDVLDLVFIHAPRNDFAVVNDSDAPRTLVELRDRGMIRAVGFSGYTVDAFQKTMDWADAMMLEYHPNDRSLEPVIAEAAAKDKIVIVKKGLASGRIPGEQAIGFVLGNPGVTSVVIGSVNLQHMAENVMTARALREWPPLSSQSAATNK
jgi:aryl-alcohol dehydrogenase-like predicted oxidoreductase